MTAIVIIAAVLTLVVLVLSIWNFVNTLRDARTARWTALRYTVYARRAERWATEAELEAEKIRKMWSSS